ncbi:protein phosphatase 2C domain-containing protein [Azotobacter armeniacus]
MQLIWSSRQGRQRASNNDALAVGRKDTWLVCMLVDAAARSVHSQRFAHYWGRQIVAQVLQEPLVNDGHSIIALLSREQAQLRDRFLLEIASYCLLCLDMETRNAQTFHVGDCLAGEMQGGAISWWASPHTLNQEVPAGSRHTLTRSLNARRFAVPDVTIRHVPPGSTLVMATDGYWAECLLEGCPFGETQDDASYLTLEEGPWTFNSLSDTDNSLVMTEQI